MNDAGGVRPSECIGNLDGALQSFIQPHPALRNQPVERLADNALHGNEVNALGLADVVDGDYVGVVQRGSRRRFLHETLLTFGFGELLRGQDFYSDKALGNVVTISVYHTHPTY